MALKDTKFIYLRNDVAVPMLGFGTSTTHQYQLTIDQKISIDAIKHAINIGYRHIDTAKLYRTERLIAKAIKVEYLITLKFHLEMKRFYNYYLKESGVNRNELFITTKLLPYDMGYENTINAFEESCKQLEVDYIGNN